ncbi:MAG: hypothetical protein JWR87_1566 [Segetibacter sp.]|jgi:hypothetical protein|nr:hypothetical protein [Segetibacter sp.]
MTIKGASEQNKKNYDTKADSYESVLREMDFHI